MKKIILVAGLLVAAVAGWFFISPLFIDKQVDESFDFALADGTFNLEAAMGMPAAQRSKMKSEIMQAAAASPDQPAEDQMPTNTPAVFSAGEFTDADAIHKGSGNATVYQLGTGGRVLRLENFRVTNGPALVVYLSKHRSPTEADHVIDAGFLNLGKLKGNVGNQNYVIPEDIDLTEYHSVVIWCELFDVLFSPANLIAT